MTYRQRLFVLGGMDACVIALAVFMMFALRFDFTFPQEHVEILPYVIGLHVGLNLLGFHLFNIYKRVWQYASTGEVLAVLKATLAAEAGFILVHLITVQLFPSIVVPRSFYFAWVFIFVAIGVTRFTWRLSQDRNSRPKQPLQDCHHALIIGAGQAGVLVAKELRQSRSTHLHPVAFIDDDPHKHGLKVVDIPVVGGREQIATTVEQLNVRDIIIAIPSAPRK